MLCHVPALQSPQKASASPPPPRLSQTSLIHQHSFPHLTLCWEPETSTSYSTKLFQAATVHWWTHTWDNESYLPSKCADTFLQILFPFYSHKVGVSPSLYRRQLWLTEVKGPTHMLGILLTRSLFGLSQSVQNSIFWSSVGLAQHGSVFLASEGECERE